MEQINYYFISVIIPVYNDADTLELCLHALENQTYPKESYEVIVIDNGSDNIHKIKETVLKFSQTILDYEELPGSYNARNKGISIAKGEAIAFTDADCIPADDWIEKGVKNLQQFPSCGFVAGEIEIVCKNPNKLTPVELYESIMALNQKQFVSQQRFGATANLFTFKSTIERLGAFDGTLKSGGDVEWGNRVSARGYIIIYASETRVSHPARNSIQDLYKKTVRYAGGRYDLLQKHPIWWQRELKFYISVFQDIIPPVIFAFNIFSDPRLKGFTEKITVSLLFWLVRYFTAYEKIRLKLGGISTRS